MTRFLHAALAVLALAAFSFPAFAAATITEGETKKFVDSMPDVNALLDDMTREGKGDVLAIDAQPRPGEESFAPYTKGVTLLKEKFPGDHKKLAGIAKKNGFSSAEDWAKTGDSVMLSYLAVKMVDENPQFLAVIKSMENMTPETVAIMPPQVKSQFDQAKAMMNTVARVSPEDKAVIKPHIAVIDSWASKAATGAAAQ